MARISDAQIDTIRQRADIVAVIGERVALEKKGRDFIGRCPFHEEKTPSFYVNPQKQAWYCHGSCKKGGDVFTFVREAERVKFPDAVRLVARRFGVAIEDETPEERARSKRKADLLDALNKAVAFYKRQLAEGTSESAEIARAFLARRGVREDTQAAFSLGVAPSGNALAKAVSKKPEARSMLPLLRELGLVRQDGRDFFSNRLLFPIADESGRWIAFGARRLDEKDEPKFLNSRDVPGIYEKKRVLYGLNWAREAKPRPERLTVVEGYIDVIIAHQAGCTNVVAACGVGFTREHTALARRFVDGVVVLFDGDAAGRAANQRVLEELLDTELDVRVAALPDKTDPDDFILREGKDSFERLVKAGSRDLFQYLVEVTVTKAEASDRPRAEVVRECARLLGKFKDDIRHQLSLKHVAQRLDYSEESLRNAAVRAREEDRKRARPGFQAAAEQAREQDVADNTHPQVREILGPHACAGEPFEVGLLEALLAGHRPAPELGLSAEDFTAGPLREVASVALALDTHSSFEARVLERLQDKQAASGGAGGTESPRTAGGAGGTESPRAAFAIATRLLARINESTGKDWKAEVEGGAQRIAERRARVRSAALVAEIERANAEGDFALVERLLAEKTRLAREARAPGNAGQSPATQR